MIAINVTTVMLAISWVCRLMGRVMMTRMQRVVNAQIITVPNLPICICPSLPAASG
jgi:hypothetical protein